MAARRVLALVGAVAVALAALATPASAAAKPPLPVPYGFLAAITNSLLAPEADPPGSNDWSCRPSAAHPRPVVLVHGILSSKTTGWQTMSPLLANNGYCVYALTYGIATPNILGQRIIGGLLPMEDSARELDAFVTRVLRSTGASKVDLVEHSEGTVMPQYWLQFLGGAARTDKVVAVAAAYKGVLGAPLAVGDLLQALGLREPLSAVIDVACGACGQLVAGSPYLKRMNAQPGGAAVPGVTYTTVLTRYDDIVIPYTNGLLDGPNATNIVVQDGCDIDLSDHLSIIATERTGRIILNALDPAHASPPPCRLSLPAIGNQLLPPLL